MAVSSNELNKSSDIPYLFEENKGQYPDQVLFRTIIPSGYLFIEKTGLRYSFHEAEERHKVMEYFHTHRAEEIKDSFVVHSHNLFLAFSNALTTVKPEGYKAQRYLSNYFIGNNPTQWQQGVRNFEEVFLRGVYPGVDLHFYSAQDGSLKYDWVVEKLELASQIKVEIQGANGLKIEQGYLHIAHSLGVFLESPPLLIHESKNELAKPGDVQFQLDGNFLSFLIEGVSDPSQPLIIDPKLIFSTYSGSRGDNFGFTATYDSRGNLYAGGITDGSFGQYPVSAGAYQTTFGGGSGQFPANLQCDISISKYDSAGNNLLYATYLGGFEDEYPHSLVVDKDDQLVIMGTSYSDNYPVTKTAFDTSHNGNIDIIVSKLNSDGTVLMASTFIGGSSRDGLNSSNELRYNYADDFRGDVFMDEDNNAYVASVTQSANFPLANAIDSLLESYEGCAFSLNADFSKLLWSTFVGGEKADALYSIKIDVDSNIVVGGGTWSDSIPMNGKGLLNKRQGNVDGMVLVFNQFDKSLKSSTYFGTSSYDQIYFVEINNEGSIFIAGQTQGNIAPSAGVYGEANKGQFIAKLDTSLTVIDFQTSFGIRDNEIDIAPTAFLVDNCEHIYMSGWGSSVRPDLHPGSTTGLKVTGDAQQSTTDGNDFYIIVLDKDATSLLYATYFGGNITADHVDGGTSRFDKKGVIYQSVCSSCPNGSEPGHQDFPVTAGAAFTKNLSPRCSNASFKIDLQIKTAVDAYFRPTPAYGCAPLDVNFENKSSTQGRFIWDFGDGSPKDTSNLNPQHRYENPGEYVVSLTVIDSNTCNISDVYRRTITVFGNTGAEFTYELENCTFLAKFSTKSKGPDYFWSFGDGFESTEKNPTHEYGGAGDYVVKFLTNRNTICADSSEQPLVTSARVGDKIVIPNIFTPNGDGFNEKYCLDGVNPDCDSIEWLIFNRWGEKLFHSFDAKACWDGSSKGVPHPSGTYFSIFKIRQKDLNLEYTVSGTITLIRED
jgi:gliding motility-associated-like protein